MRKITGTIYLEGNRNLLAWLASSPPKKFIYTSSTSVYAQNDGSVVTETSPTRPEAPPTAKILVETEKLLLAAARSLSRHHPARGGHLRPRARSFVQAVSARRGAHRGRRLALAEHDPSCSDLIGAIIAALERGTPRDRSITLQTMSR